jgi:hypothetical protein
VFDQDDNQTQSSQTTRAILAEIKPMDELVHRYSKHLDFCIDVGSVKRAGEMVRLPTRYDLSQLPN